MIHLTSPDLALCIVIVAALGYRAFRAYLDLRERERLSATAEAKIDERFRGIERQLNEHKNSLANLPRR